MPAYTKPADQWLGGQLAQMKGTVAQLNNGGTEYVVEVPQRKAGETQKESERPTTVAILGDVSHDFQGNSTGLSGWGIAVRSGGEWVKPPGVAKSQWVAASLDNSWKAVSSEPVGYYKDALGFVHLRGRVESGLNEKVVFTLPAGFRPGSLVFSAVAALNGATAVAATVAVASTGAVQPFFTTITQMGVWVPPFLAEN